MNERNKKKLNFQRDMISRQSEQIEKLKSQIQQLKLELEKKDDIITSVNPLKEELLQNVEDIKKYKKRYGELIDELKRMREIVNQEVYRGRWKIIRWLIK